MTLGTVVSQGITLSTMPVMSRLYRPEDFGFLAVFMAVSGITATVLTLRYETAIILPKNENESKAIFRISITSALIMGLSAAIASFFLPYEMKRVLGVSLLGNWFFVAILCGMFTSIIATGMAWYNRQKTYGKITALRLLQNVSYALAAMFLGWMGSEFGMIHAQWVSLIFAAIIVLYGLSSIYSEGKDSDLCHVARKHSAAPKFLLPTALLDVVTLQLPVLLIATWFGKGMAGQYSMAWKALSLPLALVGTAIGQVFLQRFSEIWPDGRAARSLLFSTWKALFVIGIVPMTVVAMYGEDVFRLTFGKDWAEAGKIAEILAPMLFLMLISSPTSGTYLVLGMQRYSLIFGIAAVVYRSMSLFAGMMLDDLYAGISILVVCEILQIMLYQCLVFLKMRNVK